MNHYTRKSRAVEAVKRAHDAVASINASGAYSDIVSDLRAALVVLDSSLDSDASLDEATAEHDAAVRRAGVV